MMKPHILIAMMIITLLSAAPEAALASTPAQEGVKAPSSVQVDGIFSRATKGKNGAVFLTLRNPSSTARKLLNATVSNNIAEKCELHTHEKVGDVYQMRQVEDMEIPAQGELVLNPGGLHIMLMGLQAPLSHSFLFELSLTFDQGETQKVLVPIKGAGAKSVSCKCGEK